MRTLKRRTRIEVNGEKKDVFLHYPGIVGRLKEFLDAEALCAAELRAKFSANGVSMHPACLSEDLHTLKHAGFLGCDPFGNRNMFYLMTQYRVELKRQ